MKSEQSEITKEPVACAYCGGASLYWVSSSDVNRRTTRDIFTYYKCSSCDLVFINPMPDDMELFYKGGYDPIPENLLQLRGVAKKQIYRMEPIWRYKSCGRLLEIGPWIGIFCCNAKDAGFDVTAIEMNSQCVEFLNQVVGVRAIQSSDPAATMATLSEKFDVISLWHSLEHLPKPWIVLERAAELLAPGGILLIAVPNIESYDFSVLKAGWLHLDAPRHLFFYTARSLEKLCSAIGLETLELKTDDTLSRILSHDAWCRRAASLVPVKYARRIVGELLNLLATRKCNGNGSGLTAIFANTRGESNSPLSMSIVQRVR